MQEKTSIIEIFETLTDIEKLVVIQDNPSYAQAIKAAKRIISAIELSVQQDIIQP